MRSLKKGLVLAAVITAGGAMPAFATANQWTEGGVPFNGPAHLEGTVTITVSSVVTTCDVTGALSLANTGVAPLGQASGQILGGTAQNCTTSLPGCPLSAGYAGMPWAITTAGADVTVSGISYNTTYGGGAGCPWSGVVFPSSGSVSGSMPSASNVIEFTNAPGISTYFGPAALTGGVEVYAEDGSGAADYGRPIELS